MKATATILALVTLLAGSAIASPGGKPTKPNKPTPPQQAEIKVSTLGTFSCQFSDVLRAVTCVSS